MPLLRFLQCTTRMHILLPRRRFRTKWYHQRLHQAMFLAIMLVSSHFRICFCSLSCSVNYMAMPPYNNMAASHEDKDASEDTMSTTSNISRSSFTLMQNQKLPAQQQFAQNRENSREYMYLHRSPTANPPPESPLVVGNPCGLIEWKVFRCVRKYSTRDWTQFRILEEELSPISKARPRWCGRELSNNRRLLLQTMNLAGGSQELLSVLQQHQKRKSWKVNSASHLSFQKEKCFSSDPTCQVRSNGDKFRRRSLYASWTKTWELFDVPAMKEGLIFSCKKVECHGFYGQFRRRKRSIPPGSSQESSGGELIIHNVI